MILVDANLLVYAHVASLPQHKAASAWLDERLNRMFTPDEREMKGSK